MTIKQLLNLMEYEQRIVIQFYAYGQDYANTIRDDLETVGDCVENLNYDCLKAKVIAILPRVCEFWDSQNEVPGIEPYLRVKAEIVH